MTITVEACDDISVISPILKVLRNALDPEVFEARLATAMKHGFQVLVASGPQGTLGCLGYRMCFDVYWGKTLYIDDLVVCPQARGGGVGSALLAVAKEQANAQDCDHIRLCSGLSRLDAHRFYEQNNFAKTSMQFFYSVPERGKD